MEAIYRVNVEVIYGVNVEVIHRVNMEVIYRVNVEAIYRVNVEAIYRRYRYRVNVRGHRLVEVIDVLCTVEVGSLHIP